MKRTVALIILVLVLFSAVIGCTHEKIGDTAGTSGNMSVIIIEDTDRRTGTDLPLAYEGEIALTRYHWSGYGVATKIVDDGEFSHLILAEFAKAEETGEIIAAVSDEEVNEYSGVLPITPGTVWVETPSAHYRLTPDLTQMCRVERHLGEGRVLTMTQTLKELLRDALYHYPYNYYTGTYNRTEPLTLKHAFDADSTVQIRIKDIKIEAVDDPKNKITLELISTVDQTITITLDCQQSDDNLANGDQKEVTLQAEIPETIEMTFGGWKSFRYQICISADNTRILLSIYP